MFRRTMTCRPLVYPGARKLFFFEKGARERKDHSLELQSPTDWAMERESKTSEWTFALKFMHQKQGRITVSQERRGNDEDT